MEKQRIFIFVPGINPQEAQYYLSDDPTFVEPACYSTVALIKLQSRLLKRKPDLVLAFCTEKVRKEKWTEIEKYFLDLNVKVKDIAIPDGKDETQLNAIIKIMLEKIPDDCYLTLDLTHGLRSCPIVFSVAVQYIKFLRGKIEIEGFYYGMLESKNAAGASPIVNMKVYLDLMEWIYAVRIFGDTYQAIQIANLLQPFAVRLGQGKVKSIQRDLIDFSNAYDLACPIEIGIQARTIGKLLEAELPECLTAEVPLAQELFRLIGKLADKYKVDFGEKKQAILTVKELERQACIIDNYIDSRQFDQVLGLIREWMVCCVMYNNGMESQWLIKSKRLNIEEKLSKMVKDKFRDKQRDLLNDWEYICSLRNPIYHHGFSDENPSISEKRIEKISNIWNKIKNKIDVRKYWNL
jgi:CRISPR-associated DxTHG motif protein